MKVLLTADAEKQFSKQLKSERNKLAKKLSQLKENPLSGKKLSGEYKGERSLRAWPYRNIYIINMDQEEVVVLAILH